MSESLSTDPAYRRCTVAFVVGGHVVGSRAVEIQESRLSDAALLRWCENDQLARFGPISTPGVLAVLLVGDLSDAQCCLAISQKEIP